VYVTYIEATPERVWDALTDAEASAAYWGHSNVSDWREGSAWSHRRTDGSGVDDVVGTVVEASRPRRLVTTWAEPGAADESGASRVTFDIEPHGRIVRLTVTHEDLASRSELGEVGSGWPAVLSNLKSYLETGHVLPDAPWEMPAPA
jgi:uncharacterized protein YndB with AHSA1/START domain